MDSRSQTSSGTDASGIIALDDAVIDQIAAGEVIERPANVVKELVENSIDANAHRVEILILDGGRERIEVHDDGRGIARDELALALRRHHTSKLRHAEQLFDLSTLGFRGEALASIAAAADVGLISRTGSSPVGYEISTARDRPHNQHDQAVPVARPPGTSVNVANLFQRIPARLAFLKSASIEFVHIQHTVRDLAFANPHVSFRLVHNRRQVLDVKALAGNDEEQWRRWLKQVFGRRFATAALHSMRRRGVAVDAWIAPPNEAHNQRDLQVLVVNGRPVRDRHLHHAIRVAFDERVPRGQYPCYAVNLTISAEAVDVNVHPAKTEVRFKAIRDVHDALFQAVRAVLPAVADDEGGRDRPPVHDLKTRLPSAYGRGPAGRPSLVRERSNTPTGIWLGAYFLRDDGSHITVIDAREFREPVGEDVRGAPIDDRQLDQWLASARGVVLDETLLRRLLSDL